MDIRKLYKLIDEKKSFADTRCFDCQVYLSHFISVLESIRPDFAIILNPISKYSVLYKKNLIQILRNTMA
jgi:hypothetical protein